MSRKWLQKEGPSWVKDGIVTHEQLQKILERYPAKNRASHLLPWLAGILVGLGLLSFVASNWEQMNPWSRLSLIVIILIGFYLAGDHLVEKGSFHTGIALIGLGVVSFGAGMLLIGQMFHLVAYDVRMFVIWGLAALTVTSLYRSPYLYLLTLSILTASQLYSVMSFQTFSTTTFLLFLAGLGWYSWRENQPLQTWTFTAGIVLQSILFTGVNELSFLWMLPWMAMLYAVGKWIPRSGFRAPLLSIPPAVAFVIAWVLSYISPLEENGFAPLPSPPLLLAWTAGALIASGLAPHRHGSPFSWKDGVLFLPLFLLSPHMSETLHTAMYLSVLYLYSTATLLQGYRTGSRFQANLGIVLFLFTTVNAYFNLAWNFMPKSLFFLTGGLLLFGLNFYLQKKKKDRFSDGGDPQ